MPSYRRAQYSGASSLHARIVGLVRNLQTRNISTYFHLVSDDYSDTVHVGEDQEPLVRLEFITFNYFKIIYYNADYVPNIDVEWLDPAALETRRHQEAHMHPKSPGQEKEWTHDPGKKDLRYRLNYPSPNPISELVTRELPKRDSMSSYPDPR